jgi:signal transduction histidine kinase
VKHASASQARIEIRETDDELSLTVEDDGTGFDPAEVPTGHLGLAGMRTRAEQIGARVAVTSGQGKGTRIQVAVPRLAREPAPAAAVARE